MTKSEIKIQFNIMWALGLTPPCALAYWKATGTDLALVKEALNELREEFKNETSQEN